MNFLFPFPFPSPSFSTSCFPGVWGAFKLPSGCGRDHAAKRHLVHVELNINASCNSNFSAVYEITVDYEHMEVRMNSTLSNVHGGPIKSKLPS